MRGYISPRVLLKMLRRLETYLEICIRNGGMWNVNTESEMLEVVRKLIFDINVRIVNPSKE